LDAWGTGNIGGDARGNEAVIPGIDGEAAYSQTDAVIGGAVDIIRAIGVGGTYKEGV
jgi:hypothetical protein